MYTNYRILEIPYYRRVIYRLPKLDDAKKKTDTTHLANK